MLDIALRHQLGTFTLDLAFTAPPGVTALFGRSGAGKTTVVNAVAGLMTPDRGRITIGGTRLLDTEAGLNIPCHRRRVGYVFQDDRLFPHLTVRQNLLFGRRPTTRRSLEDVVDLLGIGHVLDRRPRDLSGGEKSRTAIGRALMSDAQILLLDEPLAALDAPRKAEILPYLKRLCATTDIPILYVSHALGEVAQLATTIVILRDGQVDHVGPAAQILADPQVMPAIGGRTAGSILRAEVLSHDADDNLTTLQLSGGQIVLPQIDMAPGSPLSLRIEAREVLIARTRPADISALNILPATVTEIQEGAGPGAAVALKVGEDILLARISRRSVRELDLGPGTNCFAILKSTAIAPDDIGPGQTTA